jgi:hypothetical protein
MTDAGKLDGTFYNNFKAIMDAYGLPCPETLFGKFALALANVTAMAKCWAVSPTATLRELGWGLRATAANAGTAKAMVQLCETAGGIVAASYVGACIGALVLATWETYGAAAIGKLYVLSEELEHAYGADMYTVLFGIAHQQPVLAGSHMTNALMRARAHTKPGPRRGRGASGSW